MLPFLKVLAVGSIATLTYATSAITMPDPAAAQFGSRYALEDDDDVFDYRPARRHIEIDDEDDLPQVKRRIVEQRIVEREIVQPVVERTVVRRVVQPIVERRVVYRQPIVRKVIVVHRPVVKRAHYMHRPWHHGRRCFLPERHLCG